MKYKAIPAQPLPPPLDEHKFELRVTRGLVIFCVLGYLLYFAARWGGPPMWALAWIEAIKPVLGALDAASRVNTTPFPVQMVIVYCAVGFPLLTVWGHVLDFVVPGFAENHPAQDERTSALEAGRCGIRMAGNGVHLFCSALPYIPQQY